MKFTNKSSFQIKFKNYGQQNIIEKIFKYIKLLDKCILRLRLTL